MILRRAIGFAAACGVVAALPIAASTAAPPEAGVVINEVNSVEYPSVLTEVVVYGDVPSAEAFVVKQDGSEVDVTAEQVSTPDVSPAIGLVIDNSTSMETNGRLDEVKTSFSSFLSSAPSSEQAMLVSTGGKAEVQSGLTADKSLISAELNGLTPVGTPLNWDGVRVAATDMRDDIGLDPQIVLVTAGHDDGSAVDAATALSFVQSAGIPVHIIALSGDEEFAANGPTLQAFAEKSGGTYTQLDETAQLAATVDALRTGLISSQWTLSYEGPSGQVEAFRIDVEVNGASTSAAIQPGTKVIAPATAPEVKESEGFLPGLRINSETAIAVTAMMAGVTVAVLLLLIVVAITRKQEAIDARLAAFDEVRQIDPDADAEDPELKRGLKNIAQTALMRKAVEKTTEIAEDRGVLDRIEGRLEQAAWRLRAGELLLFDIGAVALLAFIGLIVAGPLFAIIGGVLGGMIPFGVLNFKASRRLKAFETQLPDMLQLMSSSLRAGYSVLQALDAVAKESPEPIGVELQRALSEAQLGRDINEAMMDTALRMESRDFEWAAMAINIQREVGGNLSEILDTVADTMVERERLRREVAALTAEGRVSAFVLAVLPPALGVIMYVVNPKYASLLLTDSMGKILLGLGIVMLVVGFLWMKKTVSIKV